MEATLSAIDVGFCRHNETIFEPVTFQVAAGSLALVTGPNGCGKTTLIRLLAGIISPSHGQINRQGIVFFLGHLPAIKNELSCLENLEFARHFHERTPHHPMLSPHEALIKAGLYDKIREPAQTLSAGQRRRLGLSRMLVAPADIWLLDEPYTSLDIEGCEWVDSLLDRHLSQGGAAVVTAHQRRPMLSAAITEVNITSAGGTT
jgi:heme exporter protein A